jgi:pyruvate dehydrogenase E1 component
LQHQDGDSHLVANTIPNCISYDPTYAFELAVIVRSGLERMYAKNEKIFYYITTMNELYTHPEMPINSAEGIIKGMYKLKSVGDGDKQVQLMGSGTILREVEKASQMLADDWGVKSDVWSATSFNELTREAQAIDRINRFSVDTPKVPYITQCLANAKGPVIVATDYMRNYAEQVRKYVPNRYEVLGTDGFGRSDSRASLRDFFEVDANHVVLASLKALVDDGEMDKAVIAQAIEKYNININKPNPMTV